MRPYGLALTTLLLAHAVWLDDEEVEAFADRRSGLEFALLERAVTESSLPTDSIGGCSWGARFELRTCIAFAG